MKILLIFILLFGFFINFSSARYDACRDKDVEFCIDDDDDGVQFDYEPIKKKKIRKKRRRRRKKVNIGKKDGVIFSKGELRKRIETIGGRKLKKRRQNKDDEDDLFADVDNSREADISEPKVKGTRYKKRRRPKRRAKRSSRAVSRRKRSPFGGKRLKDTSFAKKDSVELLSTGKVPIRRFKKSAGKKESLFPDSAKNMVQDHPQKEVVGSDQSRALADKAPINTNKISKEGVDLNSAVQNIKKEKTVWNKLKIRYNNFKKKVAPKYNELKNKVKSLWQKYF